MNGRWERVRSRITGALPGRGVRLPLPSPNLDDQQNRTLTALARRLGSIKRPTVALIARSENQALAGAIRDQLPHVALTVATPDLGTSGLHVALASAARFDAIVDVEVDQNRAQRVRTVFFHLRTGGALIVMGAEEDQAADSAASLDAEKVTNLASIAIRTALAPATANSADEAAWGRSVSGVEIGLGRLALISARDALAKIREDELERFLSAKGAAFGSLLVQRPGSTVENRAPIRTAPEGVGVRFRTVFHAPSMTLREYVRPICSPGQVVTKDNVVLPETYRHLAKNRLRNAFLADVAPRFVRLKNTSTPKDLPGDWFHLDSQFRGHFGHALTEQLSRLWAWQEAKQRYPQMKAMLFTNKTRTTLGGWEYRLYQAAGIDPSDLVLFDHPVQPERLLGATPMFSQPQFVHEGMRDLYRRIGDDLAADAPVREYPDRIFCSRRHEKRSATNTAAIEAFFADRGFEIVFPEDFSLGEQVQLFRSATELAGFGGSGMFNLAFVPQPKRVLLVSAETYVAQNEGMLAAINGHQLNVAWCRTEVRPTADRKSRHLLLQTPFTFDEAREGRFIDEVLNRT